MKGLLALGMLAVAIPTADSAAQTWQHVPGDNAPPSGELAMAFDTDRGRTVCLVYERWTLYHDRTSTWEWDGDTWAQNRTPFFSSGGDLTLAYDPDLRRMVACNRQGATSVYDGTTWTSLPTSWPGASAPSLAYDRHRDVMVLFDQGQFYELINDVWIAKGPTITGSTGGELTRAEIAYDAQLQTVLLFGGKFTFTFPPAESDRTFSFDGTTWTELFPTTVPPRRYDHQLAVDPLSQRPVLSGGLQDSPNAILDDVYEWNGTDWVLQAPLPMTSYRHAMAAFDDSMVTLRGDHEFTTDPVMWLRAGGAYTPIDLARRGRLVAHDAARRRTVSVRDTRTFEFDGYRWSDTGVAAPADLIAFAYHGGSSRCVALDDASGTWLWDGANWTQANPTAAPTLSSAAVSHDPVRDRIVVFGTNGSGGTPLNETWEWTGADWNQRFPTNSPTGLYLRHACWNAATARTFLDGGQGAQGVSRYEWDGNDWILVNVGGPAGTRAVGYDASLGIVVLYVPFGPDENEKMASFDGTTWTYHPGWGTDKRPSGAALRFHTERNALMGHAPFQDFVLTDSPASAVSYGSGCSGSDGALELHATNLPDLGATLPIHLNHGAGSSFAVLFADFQNASAPLAGGCTQLLATGIAIRAMPTTAGGFADFPTQIPASNSVRGLQVFCQALCLDPAGSLQGFATLSNGLELTIGG